jgi:hypothetical protein
MRKRALNEAEKRVADNEGQEVGGKRSHKRDKDTA